MEILSALLQKLSARPAKDRPAAQNSLYLSEPSPWHKGPLGALRCLWRHSGTGAAPPRPPVYQVYPDGARRFALLGSAAAMHELAPQIAAPLRLSFFDAAFRDRCALPFIRRFLACVGPLPASEGAHDQGAYGLAAHSLEVWAGAADLARAQLHQSGAGTAAQLSAGVRLLYAALAHDLGKLFTDMEVRAPDGTLWEPCSETLEDFGRRLGCSSVFVRFTRGRGRQHNHCRHLICAMLCSGQGEFLRPAAADLERLFDGSDPVWTLVREADGMAITKSHARGRPGLCLDSYLRSLMGAAVSAGGVRVNDPAGEAFWTMDGLLVRRGGALLSALEAEHRTVHRLEHGSSHETFTGFAGRTGLARMQGSRRLYAWYRLRLGGRIVYLQGMIFTLEIPAGVSVCDCVPRGVRPPEIAPLIRDLPDNEELTGFTLKEENTYLNAAGIDYSMTDPGSLCYISLRGRGGRWQLQQPPASPAVPGAAAGPAGGLCYNADSAQGRDFMSSDGPAADYDAAAAKADL